MDRDFQELRILKRNGFFGTIPPVILRIAGADAQSSAMFSTPFFVADRDYEVVEVKERHEVAATDGSLDILKVPDGTAPTSGTSVLASALALTGTANTLQSGVVATSDGARTLKEGDTLAGRATGLLTSLVGETVYIQLRAI